MFAKVNTLFSLQMLLSFLSSTTLFTFALAGQVKGLSPPPCGEFCYKLKAGKSICSTEKGDGYSLASECYCHDNVFLGEFVECIVNTEYCTNIQDVNRSLKYIHQNCLGVGRELPEDHKDLKEMFQVTATATKAPFDMPVEPTTYTWVFSAAHEYLDIIPTFGPCEPTTTTPVTDRITKRHNINTLDAHTITSTTTVHITVTKTVTITVEEPTGQQTGEVPVPVSSVNKALKSLESIPIISSASRSICPINITVTRTVPLITTFYSSMTHSIVTEDTRSDRPTSLHTFWTQKSGASVTETMSSMGISVLSGRKNVLVCAGVLVVLSAF